MCTRKRQPVLVIYLHNHNSKTFRYVSVTRPSKHYTSYILIWGNIYSSFSNSESTLNSIMQASNRTTSLYINLIYKMRKNRIGRGLLLLNGSWHLNSRFAEIMLLFVSSLKSQALNVVSLTEVQELESSSPRSEKLMRLFRWDSWGRRSMYITQALNFE